MKLVFKLNPIFGERNDLTSKQPGFRSHPTMIVDKDNDFYGLIFIADARSYMEFPDTFRDYKLKKLD